MTPTGLRPPLKRLVEDTDTTAGKAFNLLIQGLIVFSLVTFAVETLPGLQASTRRWLRIAEIVIVGIFTVEYVLRVAVADRSLRFVFSFYGLIDLAAILPFYLATGLDLRSIRAVRLLRLVRIFKLARFNAAVQRFGLAFRMAKEELLLFLGASGIVVYIASVGIYYFENPEQPEVFASVFHSMWWAVATLTTVGYGDLYPVTTGGKVFTTLILFVGLGVVAVPAGVLASTLAEARRQEEVSGRETTDPE